jgi:CheY-like chemotaxis protein
MADTTNPLKNLRVAIVEDEAMLALALEDMLLELGCTVAATADSLKSALKLAEKNGEFDIAVLDVNLKSERIDSAAEALVGYGVPVVFASGYGRDGVSDGLKSWPVISKPYTPQDLRNALLSALPKSGKSRS